MSRIRILKLFSLLGLASAISVPLPSDSDSQTVFTAAGPKPADLPHPDPTHSFWTHSPGANPLAGEGSTGALTDEADVCIIGSGITGVSAAYHLANAVQQGSFPIPDGETKLRAVILEARDFCKSFYPIFYRIFAGFSKVEALFGREVALRHYAIEHYSATEMARIARAAGWADTVDLVEGGHVDVMLTEKRIAEMTADFAVAVAAGKSVNVTWLSREEMNATYGTYNLFKQTLTITPLLDLRLHTRTPVTAVSPSSSSPSTSTSTSNSSSSPPRKWTLTTPRGALACSSVLHATNGYASHLLPFMAGSGPQGIVPVRGQVLAMRANAPLRRVTTASWSGNEGYWFPRPVAPGADVMMMTKKPKTTPSSSSAARATPLGRHRRSVLRAFLPEMFPGLYEQGREPEAEWTGIMGYTKLIFNIAVPSLLTPHTGQFIAAGYTGHGMPRAFGCAEAVVGMMAAERAGRGWEAPGWFPSRF
ncbi:hypothetical protein B0H13DRAFT_2316455 [Mycena leptocephala]|nr:hypothetical protein B0H13DRAFT_2316455 [Mycena leptocephala]